MYGPEYDTDGNEIFAHCECCGKALIDEGYDSCRFCCEATCQKCLEDETCKRCLEEGSN